MSTQTKHTNTTQRRQPLRSGAGVRPLRRIGKIRAGLYNYRGYNLYRTKREWVILGEDNAAFEYGPTRLSLMLLIDRWERRPNTMEMCRRPANRNRNPSMKNIMTERNRAVRIAALCGALALGTGSGLLTGCTPAEQYNAEYVWSVRVQNSWASHYEKECASYKDEPDRITLYNSRGETISTIYKDGKSTITIERARQQW